MHMNSYILLTMSFTFPFLHKPDAAHRAGPARVNIMLAAMIARKGPRFAACWLASFPGHVLSLLPRGLGTRLLVGVQLCSDLPISSTPSLSDLIHLFSVPLSHFIYFHFIYSLVEI